MSTNQSRLHNNTVRVSHVRMRPGLEERHRDVGRAQVDDIIDVTNCLLKVVCTFKGAQQGCTSDKNQWLEKVVCSTTFKEYYFHRRFQHAGGGVST